VINIGGSGWIELDGERHALENLDSLYVGRGVQAVTFASASTEAPAKFYFVSYPAHAAHPSRLVRKAEARVIQAGDQKTANRRVIRQSIRPGIVETCQLVMGFTELEPGNVWNTMPPHTHGRRSEIYMYFDVAPARVMHIMGEPSNPGRCSWTRARRCSRPAGRCTAGSARRPIASSGRWAERTWTSTTWTT
jgi:4-deoxy-L-threo-5-hexosulose-uronate ketol-isomerase